MTETKAAPKHDDPRDPSKETKITLPVSWHTHEVDVMGATGLFFSGMIMITRNKYLAWPAVLLAFNTSINGHPLRTKDAPNTTGTMLAFGAVVATYLPYFLAGSS